MASTQAPSGYYQATYMTAGCGPVTRVVHGQPVLCWDASRECYVLAQQVQYVPVKYSPPTPTPRPIRRVQTPRLAKLPVQVNCKSTRDRSQEIDRCVNAFVTKSYRPGDITSALVRSTETGAWHSGASDSRWHITVNREKDGRHVTTTHILSPDPQ